MKWTSHIDDIALRQMYLAFVRPVLEYGSTVWCNISQFDQDHLESINLSALRVIAGAKIGTSHDLLYKETGIDPLRKRRRMSQLLTARDAFYETRSSRINSSYFVQIMRANRYAMRASTKLRPIKCRTESLEPRSFHHLSNY